MTLLRDLWSEEHGLDLIEYALVLGFIIVSVFALYYAAKIKSYEPATTGGTK
jgi:Flp pilus assembly pilin Flp